MSYRDFANGLTAAQLKHQRQQREDLDLQSAMLACWRESERILGILRSMSSVPATTEGVEAWFSGVKNSAQNRPLLEQAQSWTPTCWFSSKFPDAKERFGDAFFEETVVGIQGRLVTRPAIINEDFFAALLGGERRLGHRVVYLPGEGFLYHDPKVDAFANTSDQKVQILLSNYLVKCAGDMGANVESSLLVKDHRRPSVLAAIVNRAKTVLEAHPRFFEGSNAARRYANGRVLQPATVSAPEDFIHNAFTRAEGGSVIVGEAYQEFLRYCQMGNLTRVEFTEFKRVARELVLEKFQLGLRHDIRTPEGRQTHGWKHVRLLPEPSLNFTEAA